MANTKISALISGNPAQAGDLLPIDRSGANFSITAGSIAAIAEAASLPLTGGTMSGAITFADGSNFSSSKRFGSYVFTTDGTNVYATSQKAGYSNYSGTDATVVIGDVITALAGIGGRLFFQDGVYPFLTLVLDSASSNYAAITIPATTGTANKEVTWIFQGESVPALGFSEFPNYVPQTSGVVFNITSTAVGTVGSSANIIGIWTLKDTISANPWGPIEQFENLCVRFPNNSRGNETAIDATNASNFDCNWVVADIATSGATPVAVAGTIGMYGLVTTTSDKMQNTLKNSYAIGYYTGLDIQSEHTVLTNSYSQSCVYAIDYGVRSANGVSIQHAGAWSCCGWGECIYGLTLGSYVLPGTQLTIIGLDIEDACAAVMPTFEPVYHAKETNSGNTFGLITFSDFVPGGTDANISINLFDGGGGGNITTESMAGWVNLPATGTWSGLGNAAANLTLTNAGYSTTFDQTSAVAWTWANTTKATASGYTLTQVAADSANRANENPLSDGGNWVDVALPSYGPVQILNDAFEGTVANGNIALWTGNAFNNNQYSQMTVTANTTSSDYVMLLLRSNTSAVSYSTYEAYIEGGVSPAITIRKSVANTYTVLAGPTTIVATPPFVFTFGIAGTTLYAYINGVQVITATDTSLSSGSPGMLLFPSSLANVKATNWSGGTFAVSGGSTTNQNSPIITIAGTVWDSAGPSSIADVWTIQDVIANTEDGASTLTFSHAGSTGPAAVSVPALTNSFSIALTGQTSTISATNLVATPVTTSLYEITYYLNDTTAGTSGTVSVTFAWNDGAAQTVTSSNVTFGTAGAYVSGVFVVKATSGAITYATTVTSAVGSPAYSLDIRVKPLV